MDLRTTCGDACNDVDAPRGRRRIANELLSEIRNETWIENHVDCHQEGDVPRQGVRGWYLRR